MIERLTSGDGIGRTVILDVSQRKKALDVTQYFGHTLWASYDLGNGNISRASATQLAKTYGCSL